MGEPYGVESGLKSNPGPYGHFAQNVIWTLKPLDLECSLKFILFLPFIVTTATTFPVLTLNDPGEQLHIFLGISNGTIHTERHIICRD